ncbi:MAG TPA: hypothetical protein VN699_18840 [Pirellulales bacterium]|nr:hypothetical protein [Pirellulales bacterium]
MRTCGWAVWAALFFGTVAGCSSSAATDGAAGDSAAANDASHTDAAEGAGPAEAVAVFLEAVKNGEDDKANSMLTKLALEETAKMNMVVAPPGSESATFEVGEVELLSEGDEQGAHVASKWTDLGDDGQPHTDDIVWMLRKEPEGWRIAGMATTVFEGEPPLLLNFEDPQDMQRKQQLAEEEMQRRMRAELNGAGESEPSDSEAPLVPDEEAAARQAQRPLPKKSAR